MLAGFFAKLHSTTNMNTTKFPRHHHLSLGIFIFLLSAAAGIKLKSQILLSPQITSTGTVIPLIQPKTAGDIYHMPFFIYSNYLAGHCRDSLVSTSFFEGTCLDDYDFTSSLLNDRRFMAWANNPNPLAMKELDIVNGIVQGENDRWKQENPLTWTYSSTQGIRGEYTNRQTWIADEKKRLKTITKWYDHNKPELEIEYFYNQQGQLERISTTNYDINHQQAQKSHRVWLLDEKGRNRMMITYKGSYHRFTEEELGIATKRVETAIRTNTPKKIALDSTEIESLLIYNYGAYGPEQVNYYSKYALVDDVPVFVSDSLNYDSQGRITRYLSGKFAFQYRPNWVELVYTYEPRSSRLKQLVFHRYNERENESWIDNKTIQYLSYDSKGRISSITEQQFHLERKYLQGKYTEPEEQLLQQNKQDFIYKSNWTKNAGPR